MWNAKKWRQMRKKTTPLYTFCFSKFCENFMLFCDKCIASVRVNIPYLKRHFIVGTLFCTLSSRIESLKCLLLQNSNRVRCVSIWCIASVWLEWPLYNTSTAWMFHPYLSDYFFSKFQYQNFLNLLSPAGTPITSVSTTHNRLGRPVVEIDGVQQILIPTAV